MAQNPVTNRTTLTSYCKRKLGEDGSSMIDVNVTDDQADDVIDDALQYFRDYHIDATQRTFIKHQVTSTEITNQYLTFTESEDDTVMGVVNVYPIGGSSSTSNMFNINYQLHTNDIWGLLDIELVHYSMVKEHLSFIDRLLAGTKTFNFNRHLDRLYIYMNWAGDVKVDDYILLEVLMSIDTESVYNDIWLKQYATALMKRQWGQNLSKYEGMQLPGGMTYNGATLLDQANTEIENLQADILVKYDVVPHFLIG
tara:strand:- start:3761 stop:4522 length:762 start_codon:yes stop_codon:yes gene_type:complete